MGQQGFCQAAVLGAGVMGAQIAALLASAGLKVLLFDLPTEQGHHNQIVLDALKRLGQLKPAPLAEKSVVQRIIPANYQDDLAKLIDCQLVIEAVAERMDIKESLFTHIAPHLSADVILASNTSGLSIHSLAAFLPGALQARFCGIHFFNPPRYMHLVELIPHAKTSARMLDDLETFLVSNLGKGVLRTKDTPNFIANRVGVFSMLSVMHHAAAFEIPLEIVDALTGPLLGRPKSATLRTADVVGLDTLSYVVATMAEQLTIDPWSKYYQLPAWIQQLMQKGALGQKSGAGVYKKVGKEIHVFDVKSGDYRLADKTADPKVVEILKQKDAVARFESLFACEHPQGQFLWAHFRDLFHYCAVHAESIAYTLRDLDLALRFGFAWREGPFAIWQQAGWQSILGRLQIDINSGQTMAESPLPAWATAANFAGPYTKEGAYAPEQGTYEKRSNLGVYHRQLYPAAVLGEAYPLGDTVFENEGVRCWQLNDDGIYILSFKTKMNTISDPVLDGILQAVALAEKDARGLILWQSQGDNFSVGADLKGFSRAVESGHPEELEVVVAKFQQAALALRYCQVPTVAAVKGMVFGGGCEMMLHCDRVVAACETYVGLVEAGVGLIPAGGGTKEFAQRAAINAGGKPLLPFLQPFYLQIAQAEVAASGFDAIKRQFLQSPDTVIFNAYELLYVAKNTVNYLHERGYRAPIAQMIRVAGKPGIATLQTALINFREGQFISEYDYYLALRIAHAICGGDIEANCEVDEAWLLKLERDIFVELAQHQKTQDRIRHTLTTGKPLRN